jgi:hypothetical protein
MNIPNLEELDSPKKKGTLYIKKHYPEFHQYILDTYPHINKFNAGIYLYYRHMDHPKCPVCGGYVPFLDETRGFQRCCSSKCANSDPEFRKRVTETCLRKYGTKTPTENPEIKKKAMSTYIANNGGMGNASQSVAIKQKTTMMERYGAEHALQCGQFIDKAKMVLTERYGGMGTGSKDIRSRIEKTNVERYGSRSSFGSKEVRAKSIKTNIEKYGCEIASQNPEIAAKVSKAKSKSFIDLHSDIIKIDKIGENVMYTCECPHPGCDRCEEKTYIINARRYCNRKLEGTEMCTHILPVIQGRIKNTYPEIFVRSVLSEIMPEIQLSFNNRTLIEPQEVDIYDRAHGLAFECNGCYWHSKKSPSYHKQKFLQCQQKGVQLMTIWEDWIKTKPEIVRSIIRAKYHHFDRTIYGRKCELKQVQSKDAAVFLEANHIQGQTRASVHYGLYNNNELVALASFSKMRGCMGSQTSREGQWELVRFCNTLNTQVIGGADKLLKHFIKDYNPSSIVSFSSNDISDGSLYKRLGFEKGSMNSSYWYIGHNYRRYHRSNFTRAAIIKLGLAPDREQWTETEAMMEHGFVQIYDSGQTKWVLQIKREDR